MLKRLVRLSPRRSKGKGFLSDILTTLSGTAGSQCLMLLALPVLARLYSPADFGTLAAFFAFTSIIGNNAALRYDQAVVSAASSRNVEDILALCVSLVCATTVVTYLGLKIVAPRVLSLLGIDTQLISPLLIACDIFASGLWSVLTHWAVSRREFQLLAGARIAMAGANITVGLTAGWLLSWGGMGLIAGQIASDIVYAAFLLYGTFRVPQFPLRIANFHPARLWGAAYANRKFPFFSLPGGFFNQAAVQIPILLISTWFMPTVVGFFAITQRILGAPVQFIGKAFSQVFFERVAREKARAGVAHELLAEAFLYLLLFILPIAVLLSITAPYLFVYALGEEWHNASIFLRILIPMYVLKFAVNPISQAIIVFDRQELGMFWQLALCIAGVTSIAIGVFFQSELLAISLYSASMSLCYMAHILLNIHCAGGQVRYIPQYAFAAARRRWFALRHINK